MPLRDHFRPPIDDVHSWDGLLAGWPAMIVQRLNEVLPELNIAVPGVYLGTRYEVDVGTYRPMVEEGNGFKVGEGGGVAVATYAPPRPTLTFEPELPNQDIYEVRIYDNQRYRRLIATIEIVSPSNKDRPETRAVFVDKVSTLLKNHICVSIVDVVSTHHFNLYAELMKYVHGIDPALGDEPPPMYAATLCTRYEERRRLLDNWYHPLTLGQPLPVLPIWLKQNWAIPLDLEASYAETCRTLRIR